MPFSLLPIPARNIEFNQSHTKMSKKNQNHTNLLSFRYWSGPKTLNSPDQAYHQNQPQLAITFLCSLSQFSLLVKNTWEKQKMISAQKSMAAFTSFSFLRNYATTGRIVAIVRASPRLSSSPTSINFLTPNHSRRYLCRASATHDEEAAAKAAAINADNGAPTIFDKIIAKEIPSTIVYEDDKVLAFKDISPQAPVHVLVIPKFRDGLTQLGKAEQRHGEILGQLLYAARIVAEKEGILDGFRVVINNGPSACQSVYHLHLHVLGGRQMKWPPG